ncbi:hypothetical protein [Myroides sp. N17-2]|uniref:hypothetical protein n=1 Tax=Myroides sp. N17-2 TaxID=2030799 RepID=UPI000EFB74D9|nr:hypothetical protein [Myroides sp. N17-2]
MSRSIITFLLLLFSVVGFAQKNTDGKMAVYEITYLNGKQVSKQKLMHKATLLYEASEDYYYIDGEREDGLKTGIPLFYTKTIKKIKYYSYDDTTFSKTTENNNLVVFKSEQITTDSNEKEYSEIRLELTK